VGVSQTLRRLTEGAIYIRQGGHHVGQSFKLNDLHILVYFFENNATFSYALLLWLSAVL